MNGDSMDRDPRAATVRQLHPVPPAAPGPIRPPPRPPRPALPAEVTVVRDWPIRTALVVGTNPRSQVLASLTKFGFEPVVVPLERAVEVAATVGPFTFLILAAAELTDEHAVDAIRAMRKCSPTVRVLLVCPPDRHDPTELVRAVRAGVHDVVNPDDAESMNAAIAGGLAEAGAQRERVLAIGAHPDDVEIGCAGTLLDHRTRGDRVTILTLSRGAVGGDQHLRYAEAADAADAIGAQLLIGDLPDTQVSEGIDTIRLIEAVVQAIDPSVVYVHSSHDNHQDHRAVNIASRSATRGVRRVFAYQSPSATNEFTPTQFVSIDPVLSRKVEVLSLFDSQNGRAYLEPELVIASSRYWARHLGASARYAEPFEVVRSVGDLRQSLTSAPLPAATPFPITSDLSQRVQA